MKTASHSRTVMLTVVMGMVVFLSGNLSISRAGEPTEIDLVKQVFVVPA